MGERKANCYLNCVLTLPKSQTFANEFRKVARELAKRSLCRRNLCDTDMNLVLNSQTKKMEIRDSQTIDRENSTRKPLTSTFSQHFLPPTIFCWLIWVWSCFARFHSCLPLHSFLGFWGPPFGPFSFLVFGVSAVTHSKCIFSCMWLGSKSWQKGAVGQRIWGQRPSYILTENYVTLL